MSEVEIVGGAPRFGLEEIRRRIADYLKGTSVMRAILFGSHARGEADVASDVDLVLVEQTLAPFLERGRAHLSLFRLGFDLDLLVYTPEEYERLRDEGNPLIERVEREGMTIYVRSAG